MPIITDNELQTFNESSEDLKKLTTNHEYLKESYEKTIKQRNLFLGLAILFFLIVGIIFLLKSIKPELFINENNLNSRGLTLLKTEDYKSLKQAELTNRLQYNETKNDDVVQKESIGNQTIYAVQIGAFKNNDIELFSDSFTQFNEFKQGGFYKYSLGAFETLEEAQNLRKKVIGLGFNDAFVASYVNGERQTIEEAY